MTDTGGVAMDAYVTVAEADEYMATRLHADAWTKAGEQTKQAALVTATRRIDMLRLRRRWTSHADAPQAVKDACCEEALALLSQTDGDRKRAQWLAQGLTSKRVGDASETWDATVAQRMATGGLQLLSVEARQLLEPYIIGVVPIV